MPYEVVARRWRPLTFDSVVGQRHVTATLANAIERGRVAHAFLFTGVRGVGKTTVARLLARALNCANRQGSEPCNECPSCKQILSGSSVDVLEIDGASNRGIDEVRQLIEAAQYRPAASAYRIYIIDEVHQLTREAFNALLKILEEPPEHVKFVLATTEVHKLPATVLSRCQRFDFRRLGTDEISAQLERIIGQDELEVSADALALIAREADGSMRDAQSLLEQVAGATGGQADAAEVGRLLGVASVELVTGCVEAILEGDGARIVELCGEARRAGNDPERFLQEVLELVRHVTVANAAGTKALGAHVGSAVRDAAEKLEKARTQLDLQRIFGSLLRTAEDLRRTGMPDLVLEMGLLKAAALESVESAAEILARFEEGGGARPRERRPSEDRRDTAARQGRSGAAREGTVAARKPAPTRPAEAGRVAPRAAESAGAAVRSAGSGGAAQRSAGPGSAAARSAETGSATPRSAEPSEAASHSAEHSSAAPQPPSTSGQEPQHAGASSHDDEPPPPDDDFAPEQEGEGGRWGGFLEVVRQQAGIDLYVSLSNCEASFEGNAVILRPMVAGFRRKLDDPKVLARVRKLAAEHFGPETTVRLTDGEKPATDAASTVSAHSIEEQRKARMEAEALSDPVVKEALEKLGGKVGKITGPDD